MLLTNFIEIPSSATGVGAPIQAAHVDSFRQNDLLFEKIIQGLLACPFVPNGVDGDLPSGDLLPERFVQGRVIILENEVTLVQKVPLVWFAREKIFLKNRINANGLGASGGENGDFGGSGGGQGGGANGGACVLPVSGHSMLSGTAAGASGTKLSRAWVSRALSFAGICIGGAGGGGGTDGGKGGGAVFLCAPEIEFSGSGKVEANGLDAAASNGGGGGGGLIVMIARRYINVNDSGLLPNVTAAGGRGHNTGGRGGDGWVLKLQIN